MYAGLSSKIHLDKNSIVDFRVHGPQGRGLLVKPTGEYIIFAAGTGIFPYLDLML